MRGGNGDPHQTSPWKGEELLRALPPDHAIGSCHGNLGDLARGGLRMEPEMRTDSEWMLIEGRACRVIGFTPFASVAHGKVVAPSTTVPYASVALECTGISSVVQGFVTHKVDFANLWAALKERGVSDDEEVVIFWTTKDYKWGFLRFLSRFPPKMWVTIRRRGSLDILDRLCDPTRPREPGFDSMAAVRATEPLMEWKPGVMR